MARRKSETKLVVDMLVDAAEYESPEDFAENLIDALDKARASRTSYIAVAQFPYDASSGKSWYMGIGPYPGKASAAAAASKHPGFSLATAIVIVPVNSKEGVERLLKAVG